MFKLIPLILSLALIGAGGVAISIQNSSNGASGASLQSYMYTNKNTGYNLRDSSDLFLRANAGPNL